MLAFELFYHIVVFSLNFCHVVSFKACKCALRKLSPLMGSEAISDMFHKHLIENANLHYGEFMKDLSRLIVSEVSSSLFYVLAVCILSVHNVYM